MRTTPFLRLGLILFGLLIFAVTSFSQSEPTAAAATPTPTTQVAYTGKLMGYFRMPDAQERANVGPCSNYANAGNTAANNFVSRRSTPEFQNAILVGTGDNFAPRLEARVFADVK